jgi:undecaprenyl pyrophosphate phosphatase UppP
LDLPDYFDHFLHGPMILIVMIYFFHEWWLLVRLLWRSLCQLHKCRYSWHAMPDSNKRFLKLLGTIIGFVVVGNVVTVAWYAIGHGALKQVTTIRDVPVLILGFVMTGSLLLVLKTWQSRLNQTQRSLSLPIAFILGCIQGFAGQFPGVSRFGSTFVVARLCGISSRRALQFSFLLFSPLLVGAFMLSGLPACFMHPGMQALLTVPWLIAYVVSTVVAYLGFVVSAYMAEHDYLWLFGIYMVLPIVGAMLLMLI